MDDDENLDEIDESGSQENSVGGKRSKSKIISRKLWQQVVSCLDFLFPVGG
jgi:hypothetical protein